MKEVYFLSLPCNVWAVIVEKKSRKQSVVTVRLGPGPGGLQEELWTLTRTKLIFLQWSLLGCPSSMIFVVTKQESHFCHWRLMLEQDLPPRMSAFTTPSYQPEKELRLVSWFLFFSLFLSWYNMNYTTSFNVVVQISRSLQVNKVLNNSNSLPLSHEHDAQTGSDV